MKTQKFTEGYPENAIVLAGGWRETEPSKLSVESRMRVLAAGELATRGALKTIIFSGGLKKNDSTEAEAETEFFQEHFPDLSHVNIYLDDSSHDTYTNAANVRDLAEREHISAPFALITSRSHLDRARQIFEDSGLAVLPIAAEDILKTRSAHHRNFVGRYLHSPNYYKRLAIEATLRGAGRIDRKGKLAQKVATILRRDQIS